MEVNNVHFRYSPKHPVIFDKIDFGIDMDSRICVVGPNVLESLMAIGEKRPASFVLIGWPSTNKTKIPIPLIWDWP